ncbi:MAG: L,D-transpeptidase [Chthoniobacterales bacterium]
MKKQKHSCHYLKINITNQSLEVFEKNSPEAVAYYPISSSRFGLGTEPGSFCTPMGKFFIEEKLGHAAPERMIFEGRKPTGKIAELHGNEDLILSRILWLSGLEPHNVNTRERFIYFHGTNQEELIGTPASHGCIRLRNADIIELFDLMHEGDLVEIVS